MHPARQISLIAYYYGTWLRRRRLCAALAAEGRAPIMSLFYHRVADDICNAWTIPFHRLQRQIRWLKAHFDMVSLAEAQRRMVEGNHRPAVAITFDDGYADNCREAVPFLLDQRVPVTYFVTVGNILKGELFSHDLAACRRLAPNTIGQVRAMAAGGFEIGVHGYSHADLGRIGNHLGRLRHEIVDSKLDLENALGREVRYFAFPFGLHANLSAPGMAIARRQGYVGVCSAYGAYNFPGDDPFHVQRIHADPEFIRFKNWLTLDPRKLDVPRFACPSETSDAADDSHIATGACP